jgi:membrane associated rhomboid family serine protease
MDNDYAAAAMPVDQGRFAHPGTGGTGVKRSGTPWLTIGLLAVLVLVFAMQERFAVGPAAAPGSIASQLAMGALMRGLVIPTGEWYRLVTAPFLHFNIVHLLANAVVLLLAGPALERVVGRAWLATIYLFSALGGSIASFYLQSANTTSLGASGAILGLVAASFAISFRLPKGSKTRSRMMLRSLIYLVPALLPHSAPAGSLHVDYAAHFGGALTGGAIGALLNGSWERDEPHPPLRPFAMLVAVFGTMLVFASARAVVMRYPRYQIVATYIPASEIPKTDAEGIAAGPALAAKYPNDPRSHFLYGLALFKRGDKVDAEREFREVERRATGFALPLRRNVSDVSHIVLLSLLKGAGRTAEARDEASFVCPVAAFQTLDPALQKILNEEHLCN